MTPAAPAQEHLAALLQAGQTSHELLSRVFAPLQWLLPDLVPAEGLTVLGAKMGLGKSYFLLQLAAALSTGCPFLGRGTKRQGVLLIALEDSERRIHDRLEQLNIIGTDKLLNHPRLKSGGLRSSAKADWGRHHGSTLKSASSGRSMSC